MTKIIDIHGVVPEEFRYHKDFYSAVLYEREERLAVRKSHMVIVVTKAMESYLRQKYREKMRGRIVTFPMFPKLRPSLSPRPHVDGKPVVVYAGGLHTWQQVPKMIDAIRRTASMCVHRFYCPDPA
jgi:glycosyltransferase involved in cell wall biosynthesis